ncbi:4-(cytidine 5'-diphospho)-2-C-methyl-D-erythritol kinase [Bogoriella caseilytica]|uniref:4-diphosphocytidyl-2-C-methyl-D-erythritol kinase n=1 Tax=Bogoriella caseilytica TaxID=56055 RepID=A0A3N2BAE1_9MICO|nr:4-(cytidine 5'-diphospho)-2-C-methyl-D-erythritol kinase [Bogoriella caseilytica]ROR72243.1 4-diphosphocytidyl-2-C-methyl-D-erythritol kinase [Bogoriella caseilytica]
MRLVRDVRVRAPGKINLSLTAGPPREDGYHPLETVFQAVSLYEEVLARPTGGEIAVETRGRGADRVPDDETNLAVRAAHLLRERTGVDGGVHLTITKQVPVAGGMAGGSADAAAALVACDDLWETGLSRAALSELGAELGADVPFALAGMSALGTDRGDVLTPVMSRGTYHWVLAVQDWGLSTPEVFAELDALRGDVAVAETQAIPRREGSAAGDVVAALLSADPLVLARALHNELEEAAIGLRPELADVLAAADRAGALAAVLSGSGPTVAALALDAPHAASVAGVMRGAEAAADVLVVTGPMPGARAVTAVG